MIIAHGPLGYLLAFATKNGWHPVILATQRKWVYLAAFIGGIFPDIDLFYFYLVDSTVSHRQFITHSLIPYAIIIALVTVLFQLWPKYRTVWISILLFCFGAFSHIAADMVIGMAALFSPITTTMFGLVSSDWYRNSWFIRYNLVTNFTLEFIIIVTAIGIYLRKRWWWLLSIMGTVLVSILLYWLSMHNYKPDGFFYYSDHDQDGLMNAYDADLDNDHLPNIADADIDNDGEDNALEVYHQLFAAEGSLFDYSYGHLIEVPLRLGLVNPPVLINRLFANVGLFFGEEMSTDYYLNPAGYSTPPTDNTFSETPANWLVWLEHTNHLLPADATRQEFDLIFFNSGHVALFTRNDLGEDVVLDAHPTHIYSEYKPLSEVTERELGIRAVGRILAKPLDKQY